ncbi:hypothetical protein AJ79_09291 [Helicocarpus griseus UAMH5409]|uniref:Enoyl reductase (ER) domain-containing protein n=1 Tax=Helicocarpus griseus UAMH5409 TaxID=1447875 RepID=A0A2B7WKZ1_9EURO|nr:hypothetical protein AJ79_09291 [Helicocarpus griseus UAMH5409]
MSPNNAAFLIGPSHKPLIVKQTDEERFPDEDEIVIRNAAVAINQIDWKIQDNPEEFELEYPFILGCDVAGVVQSVGSAVTRFSKGDRVIGHAVSLATEDDRHGGFQEYTVLMSNMATPIPKAISSERAVVLPLGVSTAAAALFQQESLGLPRPSIEPRKTGKTVLVWGGSTSVGSNAIQLAVAAGCEVITTASPKNFAYVKKLGAVAVVDYRSLSAVQELVSFFSGRALAGAVDTVGSKDSTRSTIEVLEKVQGNKMIVSVLELPEIMPDGIKGMDVVALAIRENEVSRMIYEDFLPRALATERYTPAPDPYVVGRGLESIQGAFEAQKKVSAQKVVVTLF